MKHLKTFFILLLIVFIISSISREETYYWSNGKKNFLSMDKNSILLRGRPDIDMEALVSKIKKKDLTNSVSKTSKREIIVKSKNANLDIKRILDENPEIESGAYGLTFMNDDNPIFTNGEILLKPKNGVHIDSILNLIKDEYESLKEKKHNTYKIVIKDWDKVLSLSNLIYESELVDYCHPNFRAQILKNQIAIPYTPTDPLYPDQYYLNQGNNIDINAPQAWGISTGVGEVRVAVIDDGVENHEDIDGRVLQGFTPTDPTGFGAPVFPVPLGTNVIIGHGQACAGIIAASQDNVGIAGIAPCTDIIPVNIFNDYTTFVDQNGQLVSVSNETCEDIRDAIDWAWEDGEADILSNSWSYRNEGAWFDNIEDAIGRARTEGRGDLGSLVVFSSGNNHSDFGCDDCYSGVNFPANVPGVITVGAIAPSGTIWNYSSRGPEMDLVAPSGGVGQLADLTTTDRMGANGYNAGNYTDTFSGTSAACPQVSGVASLMLSVNPSLTEPQMRNILQQTATDMGSSGFDNTFGFGRLNAQAALQSALPTVSGSSLLCSGSGTFTLPNTPAGSTVTWSVTPTSPFTNSNGTGSSAFVELFASTYTGRTPKITFNVSSDCGDVEISQNFWPGQPQITYFPPGQDPCHANPYWSAPDIPGVTYTWSVDNPNVWIVQNGDRIVAVLSDDPEYFNLTLQMSDGTCSTSHVINAYTDGYYCQCFSDPSCNNQMALNVYPNPVSENLTVEVDTTDFRLENTGEYLYELKIYSPSGDEMISKQVSTLKTSINVRDLKNGFYYIHLIHKEGIIREKIRVER
ncbi:S8 family peptidase [Echinicola marina]|uniref:S8 family serine peptidase n=1 Tax=Echinicola marina TaxID=2859768 RepID=UPI001CF6E5EA|nr:S8 family serine peptidase [Echinicola marina]UCS92503.1 S8 family peptidase [Echinicola marina]